MYKTILLAVACAWSAACDSSVSETPHPGSITLTPDSVVVPSSHTFQFEVKVAGRSRADVVFASSDTMIARVDQQGLVRGHRPGNALVAAWIRGEPEIRALAHVGVAVFAAPTIPALRVVPYSARLRRGDTIQLFVLPSGVEIDFRSSDPAIATVEANGVVTAVTPGRSRIYAAIRGRSPALEAWADIDVTS